MDNQFSRPAIFLSLGLAIIMVIGVIGGAKYVFATADRTPVTIASYPSAEASSQECAELVANLPKKFMGHPQAEVAKPHPDGTAAWATFSDSPVTLRCGVDLPYQYNQYSELVEINGQKWLEVKDVTPGSNLVTWYTTNRFPIVAVTSAEKKTPRGLDLDALKKQEQPFNPEPLSALKAGNDTSCREFMAALPDDLVKGYSRAQATGTVAAWSAPGQEAVVLRCGVAPAPGYKAGERLEQINGIPWFEDPTLAAGTTASTWFALGRVSNVAVHVPQNAAGDVLVGLSNTINRSLPKQ